MDPLGPARDDKGELVYDEAICATFCVFERAAIGRRHSSHTPANKPDTHEKCEQQEQSKNRAEPCSLEGLIRQAIVVKETHFLDVEEHDHFQDPNDWENRAEKSADQNQALSIGEVDHVAGDVKLGHSYYFAATAILVEELSERFKTKRD